MSTKTTLKALLQRYYTTYFRFPGRPLSDFTLALVISGSLAFIQLEFLGFIAAIVYVLTVPFTFLAPVRTMIGEIVQEKSSGMKEYLKLNGLTTFTYQLYMLTLTTIKTSIFTLCIVAGILIEEFFRAQESNTGPQMFLNPWDTIEFYILCSFGTITFILMLSTFFSDAKVASSTGGLIYVSISLCSLVVLAQENQLWNDLICLFPQAALTLSLTVKSPAFENDSSGLLRVKLIMLFDIVLYYILYIYLDQVVKDGNGVTKPYFFFLDYLKPRRSRVSISSLEIPDRLLDADSINVERRSTATDTETDTSSAVYHEMIHDTRYLKRAIQINNLTKDFKDFKAVDNVSVSIYENQIFCLLGHNGAGKTTTIKMLSGLLEIDQGEILYDKLDLAKNLNQIRTKIGICTQQDVLYERFKVYEHLELIAKLRNIPPDEIPVAVEDAIRKLNLGDERDKFSEQLSGGNKRKLCLAMAVVGRTRVLFLDEPTSGMDPQNRRILWQHLKQLKDQGLTILLTTHHLDEADELADRIAIMTKGKLLAVGTSEFFKKKFGVGYYLTLTPVRETMTTQEFLAKKPQIEEIISAAIPLVNIEEQAAQDVMRCSLPFTAQEKFSKLFTELEKIDGIRISVEMNTLEDVFVNIGISEDSLLQGEGFNEAVNINVEMPQSVRERPTYSFKSQVLALARRRVYLLTRSARNLFLMFLPLILVFAGVLGGFGISDPHGRLGFFLVVSVIAYSLNTAVYCSLPVYEREQKLKYLLDVMGLRNTPYWLGNIIIDFTAITIINLVVFGLYSWLYNDLDPLIADFVKIIHPSEFLMLSISHGFALVAVAYAWSFLFTEALSAVKYFPLIYFFILFLFGNYLVGKTMRENYESTGGSGIIPGVLGVVCPSSLYMLSLVGIDHEFIVKSILYELGYAVFYLLLTLFLESRRLKASKRDLARGWSATEPYPVPIDDEGINFEKNRVSQSPLDPIKAESLVKVYDNGYKAVQGISFGVEPGQIFGLLGPNGAGKSTTFNILTAAIPKTDGSVKLMNHEINKNMPEVYQNVGICPQFNALWEQLTVKEHLTLIGSLKGLQGDTLTQAIDYYLSALCLQDHTNKRAQNLSGGNKRKLCVANALIGSPSLIFLDEPSSGMDPLARRFLWNSIQQILSLRQASIVLTTHSMYEAESLSNKIGILINGRFVCIGPTQHLKQKYSQGYKVTVSLMVGAEDPMSSIMDAFPQAIRINDASYVQQTYNLKFEGFLFSEAFEKLGVLKQRGVIRDFSIYNTTLEQIFIYFSRFQINQGEN